MQSPEINLCAAGSQEDIKVGSEEKKLAALHSGFDPKTKDVIISTVVSPFQKPSAAHLAECDPEMYPSLELGTKKAVG